MVDAYRALNKGLTPSQADIDTYFKVLDRNNDGRFALEDIEALAIKYLVGEQGPIRFSNKDKNVIG